MQHKKKTRLILVSLICFLLISCTNTRSAKHSMSNEENAKLNLQLGERYLKMNMLKTAKERLETALALDSNNAEIHNYLGVLYERLKQDGAARKHYQKAIKRDTDNASLKNNYGRFLCEKGEYQFGMQLLKQALAMPLNSRKWFAYTNAGYCELKQGQPKLAESNFRQALQENSSYPPALLEMQKISYQNRKYMSAQAFLERYLAVSNYNSETLWFAVQTERALGNKQQTDEYREKLFNLFPTSKEAKQLKTAINVKAKDSIYESVDKSIKNINGKEN